VVRRALALVGLCGVAVHVASCAAIAGLGDYELAPSDASVRDATSEGSLGDVGSDAGEASGDDAATGDGDAPGEATDDAGEAGDAVGDSSAVEAEADAQDDRPAVPPSDKGHVLCGENLCSLPAQDCCEQPDSAACQPSTGGSCNGGVVARCDEAANCLPGQVCCVTSLTSSGIETQCMSSCPGSDPQSCRTDGECGGAGPCAAWVCAGSVVATCGAAGSATGCH
jgi:hypothetical protein